VDDDFWQTLPNEFDAKTYQSLNPDLAQVDHDPGIRHAGRIGEIATVIARMSS
jgi:hypothetical protein